MPTAAVAILPRLRHANTAENVVALAAGRLVTGIRAEKAEDPAEPDGVHTPADQPAPRLTNSGTRSRIQIDTERNYS
jgi:hypothetical protein